MWWEFDQDFEVWAYLWQRRMLCRNHMWERWRGQIGEGKHSQTELAPENGMSRICNHLSQLKRVNLIFQEMESQTASNWRIWPPRICSRMFCGCWTCLLALQSGALRRGAYRDFHPAILPRIALEHLSLYIQKHLGQSVAVHSLWKGRSWQTKAEPGTARYSRAQLGKVRYTQVQPGREDPA